MTLSLSFPTKLIYALVIALLLATPMLLVWQHYGMTRTLEISPQRPHAAWVSDDRDTTRGNHANGNSVGSLTITKDAIVMRCHLGSATTYPYCKLVFLMGDPVKGIDMSGYDTMHFDLRYSGRGRHLVKLHLMNFEPEFSTLNEWNSQRFNEVQLELPTQSTFTIPMHALRTADWWRSSRAIPLSKSYVRLDHVTALELATDDSVPTEQVITVEVRSIKFTGKWISKTTLLTWLVVAWIACGILGLSLGLLHFRSSLSVTRLRLEQLAAVDRERKAAEAAREAALAEAVGLARQRSNFLAQMSHELRTPLNAIIGYAHLLRREKLPLNERQAAGLATIHESGQHLLTLINDILDLARVEAGRMVLHPVPVHLRAFLRVVVDIMRVKAEERGLAFHDELAPGLPDAVTLDETRLRQVLLNLLGNAVKFTDRGAVSLRVSAVPPEGHAAGRRDDDRTVLRFEVVDSGIGMGAQQVARLFQPFEQVADTHRRAGGTGLGLAISQQLVRLMGGTIEVASEPHKGSTFSFTIPVRAATASPAAQPALGPVAGYEGERKRLLIVDDVPQNRAVLVDLLQQTGFVVASASNGLECLVLLDSFKPDLIVMDVMMPVIDGNETMRRIRRMPGWGAIPIIAVTASVGPDDERKSRDAGADAFLGKPVDLDALLDTIGKLLSVHWISDERRPPHAPAADEQPDVIAPPAEEIEVLWQLVRIGSMREVRERADYLRALDPAYAPFAARVHALAQGYHSKNLAAFVARYRTEDAVPPV